MRSCIFPSVIEIHNDELRNVAPDLLNGMKIYNDSGQGYLVGELAFSEGKSPHKVVNNSPRSEEYKMLVKAALLMATSGVKEPLTVTAGLPMATYPLYNKWVAELITGDHQFEYETSTFGGTGKALAKISVKHTEVLPEIMGAVLCEQSGENPRRGNYFIATLGYGTFEAILSTEKGIIRRSAISTHGLRFANALVMNELAKNHYLGLRSEHQLDLALQQGVIVANRKKINLREIRKWAFKTYYKQVVQPEIENTWSDEDFGKSSTLVLMGGGTLYPELVDCFNEEFEDILTVHVASDPLTSVSRGFCFRSLKMASGNPVVSVGIDIGNAYTVLTSHSERAH